MRQLDAHALGHGALVLWGGSHEGGGAPPVRPWERALQPLIEAPDWDVLWVDGGAIRNDFLMQVQADVLGIPVERPTELEATARGGAGLAGVAGGFWRDRDEFARVASAEVTVFEPSMSAEQRTGSTLAGGRWSSAR